MPISRIIPIRAMMVKGMPKIGSATTAPTPAEGKVDRIVTGWMKLSYNMPRTI